MVSNFIQEDSDHVDYSPNKPSSFSSFQVVHDRYSCRVIMVPFHCQYRVSEVHVVGILFVIVCNACNVRRYVYIYILSAPRVYT